MRLKWDKNLLGIHSVISQFCGIEIKQSIAVQGESFIALALYCLIEPNGFGFASKDFWSMYMNSNGQMIAIGWYFGVQSTVVAMMNHW